MRRYIKLNLIISVFAMCLLGLGCKSNAPKYESKYQAVYEYINNCENLVFWKGDICSEKYKDQFPINIFTQFLPESEARKSNVKQCTNKLLIKSNKHLLMNDKRLLFGDVYFYIRCI